MTAPQIDALRGQIFTGLFERNGSHLPRRIVEETMVYPEIWLKGIKKHIGAQSLWISPLKGCYPEAAVLLELASLRLAKAGLESYRSVLPLYIRKAAAEERRQK